MIRAHQHSTYVQRTVDKRSFAVCMNCGWQGLTRKEGWEAKVDGNNHVATTGIQVRTL